MQMTNVRSIDRTIHKTNEWLADLQEILGTPERQVAYTALRATLHALRDRLPHTEAMQLGAQLPTLLRGMYYDGWTLRHTPVRARSQDEFLGIVAAEAANPNFDSEEAARGVFTLLQERITAGEMADVRANLPESIRALWDE